MSATKTNCRPSPLGRVTLKIASQVLGNQQSHIFIRSGGPKGRGIHGEFRHPKSDSHWNHEPTRIRCGRNVATREQRLPLPGGEGRGEGKRKCSANLPLVSFPRLRPMEIHQGPPRRLICRTKKNQNNKPRIRNGAMPQRRFVTVVFGESMVIFFECVSTFAALPAIR